MSNKHRKSSSIMQPHMARSDGSGGAPEPKAKPQPKKSRRHMGDHISRMVKRFEENVVEKSESVKTPNMAKTSTTMMKPAEEAIPSAHFLGSSPGSVLSPRKSKSQVSKIYKQASELFLVRRLPEAFSTIQPLVTVPSITEDEGVSHKAPVAMASKISRIKVWVFYLALLNEISELPPEDGKAAFGTKAWNDLVGKAQDGTIWEEVVGIGYGGVEGDVDADVVNSLATLLLAHSASQKPTQRHLEYYLSTPINSKLGLEDSFPGAEVSAGSSTTRASYKNGIDTPRELDALVNIIKLFTLDVLPQNDEWEYARDFITRSEILGEDVQEGMLQALKDLETKHSHGEEDIENAVSHQEDLTEQEPHPVTETMGQTLYTSYEEQPLRYRRSSSEKDYGIDNMKPPSESPKSKSPPLQPAIKSTKAPQDKPSGSSPIKKSREPAKTSVYKRSIAAVASLQNIASRLAEQLSQNPMALLRFLLFLVGLVTALSRRDVKDRIGRLTEAGWEKVKQTVGMGVKVSYI